jgi:hypothetical protein
MKYVMLIVDEAGYWETLPEDKRAEAFDRIGQWWGELSQKGTIVGGHQLQPANTATTVKVHGGKAEVSDGPIFVSDGRFKEALGGYGILDVANLDEAIAVVKSWPGDARLELRAIVESASMDNLPTAQAASRGSR